MASHHGVSYLDLSAHPINIDAVRILKETDARTAQVATFDVTDKRLAVAALSPESNKVKEIMNFSSHAAINQKFIWSHTVRRVGKDTRISRTHSRHSRAHSIFRMKRFRKSWTSFILFQILKNKLMKSCQLNKLIASPASSRLSWRAPSLSRPPTSTWSRRRVASACAIVWTEYSPTYSSSTGDLRPLALTHQAHKRAQAQCDKHRAGRTLLHHSSARTKRWRYAPLSCQDPHGGVGGA